MKKTVSIFLLVVLISGSGIFTACDESGGINIFTLKQDRQFGEDFDRQIRENDEYRVLDENRYPTAYEHLNRILDDLLESGYLNHGEDFVWKARIVKSTKQDNVLNAFAVPGGYMYFYPGLIKYLDNEAQFAGVVAHEMAHVDRRHTTQRMTKVYGFQLLASMLLGENPDQWAKIAADLALGLGTLQFSKNDEYEADEYAVKYSSDTDLYPKGVAGFFIKLQDEENRPKVPEFLSTHPNPGKRVEKIDEVWNDLGRPEGETFITRYQEFKNALPQ
jgi:predicted Zn-dependent protease